ncbi:MAG: 1-deoxy-D-xylulose-5-phosphate reductoisomerase [Gemmatimonadales bacterium]
MQRVAILGSTGSIGCSTLEVLRRHRDRFALVGLTGGRNASRLAEQVAEWRPPYAALVGGTDGEGPDALVEAATRSDVDVVVNAVVGFAGLRATLAALEAGKRVALANKESLVVAGELVERARRRGGGSLVPIDSEHSAVLQCVAGCRQPIERLILTASGGPFREWPAERVAAATVAEALNHPTWRMGHKITVDSATLANKAMEVIEAHFLFGLGYDAVEVVVHPQSIIHGFVEFADGSMLAQLGFPSMELPILYALSHPDRWPDPGVRRFDPVAAGALTFEPVRTEVFRAFGAGIAAGRQGGTAPAVFNAANEAVVARFLAGRLPFGGIATVIEAVLAKHPPRAIETLADVEAADAWARAAALEEASRWD